MASVAREIMTHVIAGTFEQDPLAERMAHRNGEKYVKSTKVDFEDDKIRPSARRATRESLGSGSS